MALPTLKGLDHFAFACPHLDVAVEFFCDVLGAQLVMQHDLNAEGPTWMKDQLDVDASATARAAHLRLGPVTNVELWEYHAAGRRESPPRLFDRGGHHLAFYVDDIHRAAGYLNEQHGVTVLGDPVTVTHGPNKGESSIYFQSSWGLVMELITTPAGMPYESSVSARRFGPAPVGDYQLAIPTARNVDHIGLTVPNLSVATEFWIAYLGAEFLYDTQQVLDSDYSSTQIGTLCHATLKRSMLRFGPTVNLELMEFVGIDGDTPAPLNSDVGGHHIAVAVTDVDTAATYLANAPGVQCFGVSQRVPDGEVAGDHWQYLRLPWGTYLEVLSMPKGVPFGRCRKADRFEY